MSGLWVRVDERMPCPVCKKPDWCLLHVDGKKVICSRVKSTVKLKSGFLHKLYNNGLLGTKKAIRRRSNRRINWTNLNHLYMQKADKHTEILSRKISLKVETIQKFSVGWDGEAYTIPSRNGLSEMVGIMRRFPDGEKLWVSRSDGGGLFIPKMKSIEGNLFVTEGWTDAGALLELGFRALGRSNCQTGLEYIKDFINTNKNLGMITIVGDNDPDNVHGDVGQKGMVKLAKDLYGTHIKIAVLDIPKKYKDMRDWYVNGEAEYQSIIMRARKL